jgi:hypothetical protein
VALMQRSLAFSLALLFLVSALPSSHAATAANFGSYGSHPKLGDGDFAVAFTDLGSSDIPYLARVELGTPGVFSDDDFYIHFDDSSPALLKKVDDIVLAKGGATGSVSTAVGAPLTSVTGSYTSLCLLTSGTCPAGLVGVTSADRIDAFLFAIESDTTTAAPKPGFTASDWTYLDTDNSGDLTVGDIRVSTPTGAVKTDETAMSAPTGRYAKGTDIDAVEYLGTAQTTTFDVRTFDSDLDGAFNAPEDTLVAVSSESPSSDYLTQAQFYLSTSGSHTHGAHVKSADKGMVPVLEDISASTWLVSTDGVGGSCTASTSTSTTAAPLATRSRSATTRSARMQPRLAPNQAVS